MYNIYYIESVEFEAFFHELEKSCRVFLPALKDPIADKETDYRFQKASSGAPFVYNPYRCIEPLKTFFTHLSEDVAGYFTLGEDIPESPEKTIIFGVKSCDIAGHKVQDFVFLEGVETDALYKARRENTVLISSDCTDFKEVCHCLAWDILPHPTWGFDLNLSPLNDGFVVEVGSQKGQELVRAHEGYFAPAKDAQIAVRKAKRESLIDRLNGHLKPQHLVSKDIVQQLMKGGYAADTWHNFMLTCVECGGCNFICDTCHCFLLADKKEGGSNKKVRVWDSCLYANYARVAGGANPLKTRAQRLRNRFMKKFDFFVDNLKMPACCGCGRCIEVCPAKIDIREVLKDLAQKVEVKR